MALQQKPGGYASMTVPKKSKPAVKKPPAPPPRKSSVPTALTSSDVKSKSQAFVKINGLLNMYIAILGKGKNSTYIAQGVGGEGKITHG